MSDNGLIIDGSVYQFRGSDTSMNTSKLIIDSEEVGTQWEDTKQHFMDFLQEEIKFYERRYNTQVNHVCLAGLVGRWNGRRTGGKHLSFDSNPLDCMGNVDSITVYVEPDRTLDLRGHHHDGTHVMNIYLISDGLYEQWDNKGYFDTPEFYEWLIKNRKPLRLRKKSTYYNV